MSRSLIARRPFLTGTLAVAGLGTAAVGGSLIACGALDETRAAIALPLLVAALGRVADYNAIGRARLDAAGPAACRAALLGRADLLQLAEISCEATRRNHLEASIRNDFSSGNIAVVEGWIVSHAETAIAGSWSAVLAERGAGDAAYRAG